MRVLRILNELRPSGVEAGLRATADLWREKGIQIEILSLGESVGPYGSVLERAGYVIHHIPLRPFGHFLPAYIRLLRANRYDVVHVHPERANFYVAGAARIFGGGHVIRSVHNVFAYEGALRFERLLQRRVLRLLGVRHVSVSASVQQADLRYFGNPTVTIYNGYDDRRFYLPEGDVRSRARANLGIDGSEFVIVSVGNCSSVKNHTAIFRALTQASLPSRIRYLHIGLEQDDQPERQLADQLGLTGCTEFLGHVPDPAPILHAADCYVMPSEYEGLGNAALEALACGVPSILADVPGLRDLKDFFDGIWWVRPLPGEVAIALERVAKIDEERRRALGHQLAESARTHFRSNRVVEEYAAIYAGRQQVPRLPRRL